MVRWHAQPLGRRAPVSQAASAVRASDLRPNIAGHLRKRYGGSWQSIRSRALRRAPLSLWRRLSLAERFALTGGVVMLLGMAVIGSWVASRIEEGVTRNTANATALYVESVIAPLSQELTRSDGLSAHGCARSRRGAGEHASRSARRLLQAVAAKAAASSTPAIRISQGRSSRRPTI